MAMEQILLNSSSFDGMRETGGFGQPLHTLYPQIRAVLAGQLGAEVADLLAEPVVDRARGRIDWYAEGDPDRPPIALAELTEQQRQPILARIEHLLGQGRQLAERYAASGDVQRMQLAAILKAALGPVTETGIFLVDGRPVVTGWGFAPDRPWETPTIAASAGVLHRPSDPVTRHDVAIPDIALPELAAEPPPVPELPPQAPPVVEAAELIPPPVPEIIPEPGLPPSAATAPPGAVSVESSAPLPKSDPEPPLEPLSPPGFTPIPGVGRAAADRPSFTADASQPARAEAALASPLRYVVVGSRYFWSVFILALLLALGTGLWFWLKKPVTDPMVGDTTAITLTEAQRTETELRARLETLLVQLAERRGQCPLPDRSVSVVPTLPQPDGRRSAIPAQSTVAVAGGVGQPDTTKAPVLTTDVPTNPPGIDRSSTVLPDRPLPADPATVPPLEIPAGSLAASGRNSSDMSGGQPLSDPQRMPPGGELPAGPTRPATPATAPDVAVAPPLPASRTPSRANSPAPTLEEVLADRPVAPVAPAQYPPPVAAPVKAEPTLEERREFANRLSAAGAATGEITVALLWNGRSDLDLVVRCPAGRQLDYQHPAECGGALDVDANAVRDKLSDRPVESAFWPAGKATPGNYEIAVRYAPRKDEMNPAETSYQVRLIRGGQESTYKGTLRPNTTMPVTTFTVDR